jgi:hypothetical protein
MKLFLMTMMVGVVLFAGSAFAQADQGMPDSLIMEASVTPDVTTNQMHLKLDVYCYNDVDKLIGISCGFGWDNPNLVMDSARPSLTSFFAWDKFFLFDGDLSTTNLNKRFLFSGFTLGSKGLEPDPARQLMASYYFTLSSWSANDEINIDSLTYDDGSELLYINFSQGTYKPIWSGPILIRDSTYSVPSNLQLSTTELSFDAVEGGAAPPSQTFDITSDNDPLGFTVTEDASWLLKSPSIATTPSTITVSINNFGLTAGMYQDTLYIESATAANSPLAVAVTLNVAPPPAEIVVSQKNFLFNAVVEGANPAPQSFDITNIGGQDLNWTITSIGSWLGVAPTSGTNGGTVELAPDITGLGIGTYFDSIYVNDPDASNSPIRVIVQLSVASGLPEISVFDSNIIVVVDLPPDDNDTVPAPMGPPTVNLPPKTIQVLNIGGGVMNFTVQSNSIRIGTITPSSGSAPQELLVEFSVATTLPEGDYFDTLWVYSEEAINSPYPVEFHFHARSYPADLRVSRSTIQLQVYPCLDGTRKPIPTQTFYVYNFGQDSPMAVYVDYDTEMYKLNKINGFAPTSFVLTPLDAGLAPGTYYDTIVVRAPYALQSPKTIEVQYVVLPDTLDPEIDILLNSTGIEVVAREESGPFPAEGFTIYNENFGCMEWYFDHNASWALPNMSSGNVKAEISFVINPAGLSLGTYTDTVLIYAPGAVHSPRKLPMTIHVWRLRGDCDSNGKVNLADITYLIIYVYMSGPAPWPTLEVGDVNCDGKINLADITAMISYVYQDGPILCDNPYVHVDQPVDDQRGK